MKVNLPRKALKVARGLFVDEEFMHAIQVATLVGVVGQSENMLCAAYLHHAYETGEIFPDEVEERFNNEISTLIAEVTPSEENTYPELHSDDAVTILFACRLADIAHGKHIDISKFWNK